MRRVAPPAPGAVSVTSAPNPALNGVYTMTAATAPPACAPTYTKQAASSPPLVYLTWSSLAGGRWAFVESLSSPDQRIAFSTMPDAVTAARGPAVAAASPGLSSPSDPTLVWRVYNRTHLHFSDAVGMAVTGLPVTASNASCAAGLLGKDVAGGHAKCVLPYPDSDGDLAIDCLDGCPSDPTAIVASQCGGNETCPPGQVTVGGACVDDGCPSDALKLAPGLCGCGNSDVDSDGDGALDGCAHGGQPQDACPSDASKTAPGACGCGKSDGDADGDGALDGCAANGQPQDGCPNDASKTAPGTCGCGKSDGDSDGDGALDGCAYGGQPKDACPHDANKTAVGLCGCGKSDGDTDGDGALDGCAYGGAPMDLCPLDAAKTAPGACGCGANDTDTDGDGAPDDCPDAAAGRPKDECVRNPTKVVPGVCGCAVNDTDRDGDHVVDCEDGCPDDPLKLAPGSCGCGNVCDADGPTCSDRRMNGNETDVDCGGPVCGACDEGMLCSKNSDCGSGFACAVQADGDNRCATVDDGRRAQGTYVRCRITFHGTVAHDQFRGALRRLIRKWLAWLLNIDMKYIVIHRVVTTNSIALNMSVQTPAGANATALEQGVVAATAVNVSNAAARSNLVEAIVGEDPSLQPMLLSSTLDMVTTEQQQDAATLVLADPSDAAGGNGGGGTDSDDKDGPGAVLAALAGIGVLILCCIVAVVVCACKKKDKQAVHTASSNSNAAKTSAPIMTDGRVAMQPQQYPQQYPQQQHMYPPQPQMMMMAPAAGGGVDPPPTGPVMSVQPGLRLDPVTGLYVDATGTFVDPVTRQPIVMPAGGGGGMPPQGSGRRPHLAPL